MTSLSEQAWAWLKSELDRWQENGIEAEFWWRDDDAVSVSPQLEMMARLAEMYSVPVALAVIPAKLKPDLVSYLEPRSQLSVLQHGYAHISHAPAGQRKLELGGSLDAGLARSQLETGLEILQQHFASRFVPALVPPWNRIDNEIIAQLTQIGFHGISVMKVRKQAQPCPGLLQVNTHLDPVNWRHQQGFIGDFPAIAILVQHLVSKRTGYRDIAEPTGILTHHLVQNARVWQFVEKLLQFLQDHPATTWRSADKIWNTNPQDGSR